MTSSTAYATASSRSSSGIRPISSDELRKRLVSANVYLGFGPVLEALRQGADVVVTGRGADVAPYMAALVHRFDWDPADHELLARAAVIGHLLECGRCVTGTCFEEPAFGRHVPDPGATSRCRSARSTPTGPR